MAVTKTHGHAMLAKVVAKSVVAKPPRAAAIIARAIILKAKDFPMSSDKDFQQHVAHVASEIPGAREINDLAAQIRKLKMPDQGPEYKDLKGKYGSASADLVRQICEAERNVTPDKVKDALDSAAGPRGQSGVKELEGHRKYKAELKITGAGKRLYATRDKTGGKYAFVEMGKHT